MLNNRGNGRRIAAKSALPVVLFIVLFGCTFYGNRDTYDYSFDHDIRVTSVDEALAWCDRILEQYPRSKRIAYAIGKKRKEIESKKSAKK